MMQEFNKTDLFTLIIKEYEDKNTDNIDEESARAFARFFAKVTLDYFYLVPRDPKLDGKIIISLN